MGIEILMIEQLDEVLSERHRLRGLQTVRWFSLNLLKVRQNLLELLFENLK